MTEDELFPIWRDATGEEKDRLTNELAAKLTRHANSIVWRTLGKHYKEPVNVAVYRALTRADSFRGNSRFSTWFHSIVYKACMDYVRRLPTRETELREDMATDNPEDAWIEGIDLDMAIAKLEPKEQRLVNLRREGYSDKEVGERFGVDPSTVHYWWKEIWRRIGK